MQRWFFLDDKANDAISTPISKSIGSSSSNDGSNATVYLRQLTFNVFLKNELQPNECVAITGAWDSLGNWNLQNALLMKPKSDDKNNWFITVEVPRDREIGYRYLVCAIEPINRILIIRHWETHLDTRKTSELQETKEIYDTYGDFNGLEKIDRGWLTSEKIIQLKFFNAPFKWKQRMKNRNIYIKITPMSLKIHGDNNCYQQQNNTTSLDDSSLSNDTKENPTDQQFLAFTEVVSLKFDESILKPQEQFGIACGQDDLVIFNITVMDFDNIAYLIDLFAYSSKAVPNEPPFHLGYHYILPNILKRSDGKLELPITCATKHRPLGMMQCEYLIIKPFSSCTFNMSVSYQRYWNKKWSGLDVGHRGSGTSFKAKETVIRENTIASLKKAAQHGADMVEFDVQLSKDLVPVIYHDFNVYVSLKSKKSPRDTNDFLELPMNELTLEQLKNFKVYHVVEGRTREPRIFENEDCHEHQPFPLLADALDALDPHVGFNIEIKWSQELIDGTTESHTQVDRNLYLDCILDVVLRKAGRRRIVFSSFDPDICTMLRYKQNMYPVMFLTLGQTDRYIKFSDPRCNTTELAVCNARAMELLGIVAHTEDLLRDPTKVNLATNVGLIVFCWGDDNNSKDTILMLKKMGLHAIIYDKMDVFTTKENKESVFLVQARESQNDMLKLQCFEMERNMPPPCDKTTDNTFKYNNYNNDRDYNMIDLENERQRLAVSTSTSFDSLFEKGVVE